MTKKQESETERAMEAALKAAERRWSTKRFLQLAFAD